MERKALGIRFTGGAFPYFEFLTTQIETKSKYMEARWDDLELIPNYGTLLTERDKRVR
jgi:hypothetical protein